MARGQEAPFWREALGSLGLAEAAREMSGVGPSEAEAEQVIAEEEARGYRLSPQLAAKLHATARRNDAALAARGHGAGGDDEDEPGPNVRALAEEFERHRRTHGVLPPAELMESMTENARERDRLAESEDVCRARVADDGAHWRGSLAEMAGEDAVNGLLGRAV